MDQIDLSPKTDPFQFENNILSLHCHWLYLGKWEIRPVISWLFS
ncbi:hypothetical protein B4064_1150 [Caldibacillus thermoamylovorans]|nr:hypothetical protein B4065_1740 [Caldibacillus thermoamylovorans]KIO69682.1 hypothetical protein B4064_1150 [Caldibacillus thermoamylovorans]